jgi:STAM-binding protein
MNITDLSVGSRPMSARELTDKAKEFDWNPRIPFKYWARAAETIHHEVCPPPHPSQPSHPG